MTKNYSNDYLAEIEVYRKTFAPPKPLSESYRRKTGTYITKVELRAVKMEDGYAVEQRSFPLIEAVDGIWNDGWRTVFESTSEQECISDIDETPDWIFW